MCDCLVTLLRKQRSRCARHRPHAAWPEPLMEADLRRSPRRKAKQVSRDRTKDPAPSESGESEGNKKRGSTLSRPTVRRSRRDKAVWRLLLGFFAFVLEARRGGRRGRPMRPSRVLSHRSGARQRSRVTRLRLITSTCSLRLISLLLNIIHEHRQIWRHILCIL